MSIPTADLIRLAQLGRRAEQKRELRNGCLTALAQLLIHTFVGGWMFMLAAGVIHAEWIPALPTLGYWWSVLIAWLLRGALSTYQAPASKPKTT